MPPKQKQQQQHQRRPNTATKTNEKKTVGGQAAATSPRSPAKTKSAPRNNRKLTVGGSTELADLNERIFKLQCYSEKMKNMQAQLEEECDEEVKSMNVDEEIDVSSSNNINNNNNSPYYGGGWKDNLKSKWGSLADRLDYRNDGFSKDMRARKAGLNTNLSDRFGSFRDRFASSVEQRVFDRLQENVRDLDQEIQRLSRKRLDIQRRNSNSNNSSY